MFEDEDKAWDEARKRNLRISIAKGLLEQDWELTRTFSEEEIKNIFRFKMRDLAYYREEFWVEEDGKYRLTENTQSFLERVFKAHKIAVPALRDADAKFVSAFGSFCDQCEKNYRGYSHEKYMEIEEEIRDILPVLHWGHLPIFNKYLLYNREYDPEKEMMQFYDHFDCLKAMLDEIRGNGEKMQIESDKTLNRTLNFDVYTRRWGHEDRYVITRTIDGWKCSHLATGGTCNKNGEGGLIRSLKHDCVFFPEDGVKYAMEELWNDAEDGNIEFAELQQRLQQIADWISHVERAVGEMQPEWVGYY